MCTGTPETTPLPLVRFHPQPRNLPPPLRVDVLCISSLGVPWKDWVNSLNNSIIQRLDLMYSHWRSQRPRAENYSFKIGSPYSFRIRRNPRFSCSCVRQRKSRPQLASCSPSDPAPDKLKIIDCFIRMSHTLHSLLQSHDTVILRDIVCRHH